MGPDFTAERIRTRNRGEELLRRLTLAAGALAAGVTGLLAAVTASGARTHTVVPHLSTSSSSSDAVPAVPEPTATVSAGPGAPAGAPASAPNAPPSPPTSSSTPPVAVSGGS